MRDLVSLRQERAEAYDKLESLVLSGTPDDADEAEKRQQEIDAADAKIKALDAEVANVERLQKLKSDRALPGLDRETPSGFMAKYRDLPASAHQVQPGRTFSQAQLAAFGDFLNAVRRSKTSGQTDPLLIEAALGSNEAISEDGGFLVDKDLADGLLRRTFEVSRIARKARRIPISARSNGIKINALKDDSRVTGARWGGVQIYHIGEGDALTPSRPKFRQMNLQLKKMAGLLYATSEMLQDSIALAAVMSEAFPEEFAFTLDDVMFEGDGASQGLGFMNGGLKVTIPKETGQAAKTIQFENITEMFARLPARSIPNSEWWINQDCYPALMEMHKVVGTGGVPVFLPPGGLSSQPFGTLLGRPVMPIEYANTLGTEGDITLVDPTSYVMIDKGDIQYATSIHVAFLTDEQAFRFIYRYDGQPVDNKPITPFKGSNKQSTFITLANRA